ncbi:hypothetical protein, partial [Neisseria meningitidis]|uniref:hypothetical protein n=1 Tax=Neisseria meningitidis TaxID=487 RepID=UPI00129052D3
MNKTWKRQVFRHTALYTAILMFSHTGGGGGGGHAQTHTHKIRCVWRRKKTWWGKRKGSILHLREK